MAGPLAKLSRRIVALAAFLVPAGDRGRWKQEWEAELAQPPLAARADDPRRHARFYAEVSAPSRTPFLF